MLWRTSHHTLWWLQCQVAILVMSFVRQVRFVWAWWGVISCDEGLGFRLFRIFVPNNCYLVRPFQQCKGLFVENLWKEIYFHWWSALGCRTYIYCCSLSFEALAFFIKIRFVFDISLHGVVSNIVENHFRLFGNIFSNLGNWCKYSLRTVPIFMFRILYGTRPWNTLLGSHRMLVW